MKTLLVLASLAIIAMLIAFVFWKQELKYALPTPIPDTYAPVAVNAPLHVTFLRDRKLEKPVHFHFYNPNCPCSRFNTDHFISLVNLYRSEMDFYVVVPGEEHQVAVAEKFKGMVSVLVDDDQALANAFGVYSTPQAVLVDTTGRLYYRGNYNKTRYCTDPKTNYAQLAIVSLLAGDPAPNAESAATTSYGCELNEDSFLGLYIF